MKLKYNDIPHNLIEQVTFHTDAANGVFANNINNRLYISDKYIIAFCCKLFNELPINVRNCCKLSEFKNLLNEFLKL